MTQQEIKERNNQIALMLGWVERPEGGSWEKTDESAIYIVYSEYNNYPHKGLPFNRDWNWLMEAVEFIKNIEKDYPIATDEVCSLMIICKKEAVFIAVSDFAKLYVDSLKENTK